MGMVCGCISKEEMMKSFQSLSKGAFAVVPNQDLFGTTQKIIAKVCAAPEVEVSPAMPSPRRGLSLG